MCVYVCVVRLFDKGEVDRHRLYTQVRLRFLLTQLPVLRKMVCNQQRISALGLRNLVLPKVSLIQARWRERRRGGRSAERPGLPDG